MSLCLSLLISQKWMVTRPPYRTAVRTDECDTPGAQGSARGVVCVCAGSPSSHSLW